MDYEKLFRMKDFYDQYAGNPNFVEVVRCKDCKYRMTSEYTDKDCVCDYTQLDMYDDDYCSYGERTEE